MSTSVRRFCASVCADFLLPTRRIVLRRRWTTRLSIFQGSNLVFAEKPAASPADDDVPALGQRRHPSSRDAEANGNLTTGQRRDVQCACPSSRFPVPMIECRIARITWQGNVLASLVGCRYPTAECICRHGPDCFQRFSLGHTPWKIRKHDYPATGVRIGLGHKRIAASKNLIGCRHSVVLSFASP